MSSRVGSRKDCGAGMGEVLPPVSAALESVRSVTQLRLCSATGIWKNPPSKHTIDFAEKQLSRSLSSPVEALRLVCNAIISSAIAAVQLSEHISKWIARQSALVHTGAPAVMRTALLLGHTHNRAAGERQESTGKFPLSLVGFLLVWIWSQKTSKPARCREKWELLERVEKAAEVFLQTLQKECLYD